MKIRRVVKPLIDLIPFRDRQTRRRELAVFVFCILVVIFIETFRRDPNLAISMMAFGTLLLAFVTWWSVQTSREKEMRDRKERLLDKLIDWALKAGKCGYGGYIPVPYPINKNAKIKMDLDVLNMTVAEARTLSIEGQYMKEITVSLLPTIKEDLAPDVQDIIDKLDVVWKEAMQYLIEYKEGKLPSVDNVKALRESAEAFTKKAAKVTGRLISI